MSGPVCNAREEAVDATDKPEECQLEVTEGHAAKVGAIGVNRLVPRRARRTVGAWCFVDHMGPAPVTETVGLDVGPHPHIGLQTVTWLFEGSVLHRDSMGFEQLIRPGQLNLMTAGHGVSHSEETRGIYAGDLHGIQFWVAQPDSTRNGEPAFEHYSDLPQLDLTNGTATVIIGSVGEVSSPARRDTDHSGAELDLRPGESVVPLRADYEYAVALADGAVTIDGTTLTPGKLGYLGIGRDEFAVTATEATRMMLFGGVPLEDELVMWWNYVARTRDEITDAHNSWTNGDGRFGSVASPLDRVDVDPPLWAR